MQNKKGILLIVSLVICLAILFIVSGHSNAPPKPNANEIISKMGEILGDNYTKHSITELTATLTYRDITNNENQIYYHILKTTFYNGNPTDITGLNTEALGVLFCVELMDTYEIMQIQNCDAALFKNNDVAYLCWTYSPEFSYVLEFNPNTIDDTEIIKMAESACPVE